MMPDYSKSKIYKIICNITGLVYIGSTCQTLSQRLQDHKSDYKKYLNKKIDYISSFKILENDNYNIILVEDFCCERRDQLHAKERYWIETTDCVNINIPTRTKKEHYQDNKETYKEITKKYRENNILQIKEKGKKYRENNIQQIKVKSKKYRENNIQKIKEYKKQYYLKNKEKIKEYKKQYYLKNKEKTKPPENVI
jgi:hypothetical protein